MKRLERLAVWLLLTLGFCGCVHSRLEQHKLQADLQAKTQTASESSSASHAASESTEKRTQGPTDVETTKAQLGVVVQDAAGAVTIARVGRKPLALPKGSRVIGTVPLAETKRDEHRGPVVDEKKAAAVEDSAAKAKGASTSTTSAKLKDKGSVETKTSWWPPWWVLLGAAVLLVVAGAAAWKLKPSWLGQLWKLLRRAPPSAHP